MKFIFSVVTLLFSISCFALPECEGSPVEMEMSDALNETQKWTDCKGEYVFTEGVLKGQKYVGEFKNGRKHGQGRVTNLGLIVEYVGGFKDGIRHGQGTQTYADGEKYVGEYKNDEKHGQGTQTWPDGGKYVGSWVNGKKEGQGTYTFPNGQKYVGELKYGTFNGQGTYTWPSGQKYVGKFKGGNYHGWGKLTLANGTIEEGIWEDNELVKSKETIENEKKIAKYKEELRIKPITGIFMSGEEKCVNAQIDGWNATDPNPYGTKYIEGKSYSKKEQYLAYAWRECKGR